MVHVLHTMAPIMAATSLSRAMNQSEMMFQEGAKMYSHEEGVIVVSTTCMDSKNKN